MPDILRTGRAPTIFDFQRDIDAIIRAGEDDAKAEATRIKSEFASTGVTRSTLVTGHTVRRLDEIHEEILEHVMKLIRDFRGVDGAPHSNELLDTSRSRLEKFSSTLLSSVPSAGFPRDAENVRTKYAAAFRRRLDEALPKMENTVFIGHGKSPVWRELKDFLSERLKLQVEEFNSVSTAGIPTANRLSEMLAVAGFAFLVMTAEDEQPDGKFHALLNVVHEAGLFQGRLGFDRAIVLLESGCEEFSNIHGLGQIRFPKDNINAKFEEIRTVLEREGLIG